VTEENRKATIPKLQTFTGIVDYHPGIPGSLRKISIDMLVSILKWE
jgi:hypothetical protein